MLALLQRVTEARVVIEQQVVGRSGMRPSLSPAAPPGDGRRLFSHLLSVARSRYPMIESGEFGAHMQVSPTNDDPVTFMLQVKNSQLKSDQAKSD